MGSPAEAEGAALGERRDDPPELLGPFRIHGILGRGGMGVVFDAATPTGQRVALKVIRPQAIDPDQAHILVARFHREAKILQQMNHPGVVRLVDAGEVEGTLYLAMERIEGVSLLAIRRRGPLGFDALVQLGIQLADALQHLHEAGVIHRDIKPANILINAQGQPVITDFGISGMSEATGITRMGDLLGSPGFMAPEVTEGAPPTELSDQFALGRLLYELGATGPAKKLPRNAPILQILSESLEIDWNRFPKDERWPALEPVLRRMLATEPLERFPNARAARASLLTMTTSDLLDLDTLSEHIGALGVSPRMSWDLTSSIDAEVDAAAIEARAPAPPSPPLVAPRLSSSWASAIRGVPATVGGGSEDVTMPPPPPRAPQRVRDEAATIPPDALPRAAFEALRGGPNDTIPEPIPASVLGAIIEQHVVVRTKSDASVAAEPRSAEARDTRPDPPARPSQSWPEARALEPKSPEPTVYRFEERSAAPLSGVLRESLPPLAIPGPESTESQLARVERQNARLREQLSAQSRSARGARPSLGAALGLALAVVAGFIAGWLVREVPDRPLAPVVLVAPASGALADPAARYGGTDGPTPDDATSARGFHAAALEHLERQDLPGAEGLLRQCIETADLPECHRTLGTILALTGHPAARTHFDHYLHIAPSAPDADAIRRLLQNP